MSRDVGAGNMLGSRPGAVLVAYFLYALTCASIRQSLGLIQEKSDYSEIAAKFIERTILPDC